MPPSLLCRALPLALLLSLAAGARADDAPAKCRYANVATLPVRYLSDSFQPAVEGVIDGAPASMMLDTGASRSLLTRNATDRLKLSLRMSGGYATGIGGASRLYSTRVQDFGVGPAHSGKASMYVIGDTGGDLGYDALVGADFLLQADLEFALAEKQVRFFRPQDCQDSFLAYWSSDAIVIPFTRNGDGNRNPEFTVELNGVKLTAVIDSGASASAVFVKAARKAGINTEAPGVLKRHDTFGVGETRVKRWSAVFDSFAIGDETVRNAEIDILDTPDTGRIGADMLLGADFLRAHRVLFAMSQQRLYISYLGGPIFSRGHKEVEPWLQQEADGGNPHAQFRLAAMYQGGVGVAKDRAQAAAWLKKAADQGHSRAGLQVGRQLLQEGRFAEAAERLGRALARLPDEHRGAMMLYLARLQAGDAATAARELEAWLSADRPRRWPAPVAEFYLGRIGVDALLARAGKEPNQPAPVCEANFFASQLYVAQGDKAKARSVMEAKRAECARPGVKSPEAP